MGSSRFDGSEGFEPPDDLDEFDDFDRFDEFDDQIRNEFDRAFVVDEDPNQVFDELTPAFGRARRIHRAKQTLVGAAASILVVAGASLAVDRLADSADDSTTIAAEPALVDEASQETPVVESSSPPSVAPNSSSTKADTGVQGGSSAPTVTVPADQTTATPTSSTSWSTTAVPAVPNLPSTTIIDSACGSITVSVLGDTVELLEVNPATGYYSASDSDSESDSEYESESESEYESDSEYESESESDSEYEYEYESDSDYGEDQYEASDSVDVRFEGSGERCDIKVEVESGRLEVENERG